LDLYIAQVKSLDTQQINFDYNFLLAATNYTLEITKTILYDIISDSAKRFINSKELADTLFIVSPQNIEFSIVGDSTINEINLNYVINCHQNILGSNFVPASNN
jgi:hypothetical protein